MANTGTLYPGTVTSAAATPYDDLDWNTPANARADDTNYTSITAPQFDTGIQSYMMSARIFGATIPTAGTITGVQVEVGKYYAVAAARDAVVQLINGIGTALGNNLGSLTTDWPTTAPGTVVYGGSTNLWNATLTPTIVNSDAFGVQFAGSAAGANTDAYVDFIRMVIYYSEPLQWNITGAEASQSQTSDAGVLYSIYPVAPAEGSQSQTSDAASLSNVYPTYEITVAEATQTQTSDLAEISFDSGVVYTPQTGLLDSFDRADENPMNGNNWGSPFEAGHGAWKIVSNQAMPVG